MGPPPDAAEGSGQSATQPGRRRSKVTVEDVPEDEYEGEASETEEEACRAALEEEEDRRAYEQKSGWEDDFDEQFWDELEAEMHEAAGHTRESFHSLHVMPC
jgi:hypothetical protein